MVAKTSANWISEQTSVSNPERCHVGKSTNKDFQGQKVIDLDHRDTKVPSLDKVIFYGREQKVFAGHECKVFSQSFPSSQASFDSGKLQGIVVNGGRILDSSFPSSQVKGFAIRALQNSTKGSRHIYKPLKHSHIMVVGNDLDLEDVFMCAC